MRRIAIINGGSYLPMIHNAFKTTLWEVTEWETIPLITYDFVYLFLENIIENEETRKSILLRTIRREFMEYVKTNPPTQGWVIIAPQDNDEIRKKGIMRNHNRCILDACRFGFQFKKRFRLWSSFPMKSVLCNKSCPLAKNTILHDPKIWSNKTDPHEVDYIELLKKYDKREKIPSALIYYIAKVAWGDIRENLIDKTDINIQWS